MMRCQGTHPRESWDSDPCGTPGARWEKDLGNEGVTNGVYTSDMSMGGHRSHGPAPTTGG